MATVATPKTKAAPIATTFEGLGAIEPRDPQSTPLGLQTVLLFGAPGTGKTTLAAAFPNHLYFDLENSATGVTIDPLPIERTWAHFKAFVDWAYDGGDLNGRQTLVIDTVTDLWKLCQRHVLADLGISDPSDGDYGSGFTKPRAEFMGVMEKLWALHARKTLGTVLIAHEVVEEIKTAVATTVLATPEVDDKKIKTYVAAKPQMVLRTVSVGEHPKTGVPFLNDENQPEARFLTQAKATVAGAIVKDRTGRLPAYFGTRYETLADCYDSPAHSA